MPQIVFTQKSTQDLARFEAFLDKVAPEKTTEAIHTIIDRISLLQKHPEIGAIEPLAPQFRKLVIPYGKNGYVALYLYDKPNDIIRIQTIRHMRELTPQLLSDIT